MSDLSVKILLEMKDRVNGSLQKIARGSERLTAGLQQAQQRLDKLAQQQRALDGLNRLRDKYRQAANTVSAARAQLLMLQTQMPATSQAQRRHAAEIKRAQDALERALRVQDRYRASLLQTRSALTKMGVGKLADAQAAMPGQMDNAVAALKRQQEALAKLDAARQRHKTSMMKGSVWAAVGMGVARTSSRMLGTDTGALGRFMEHEDAMLGIARQVPASWLHCATPS